MKIKDTDMLQDGPPTKIRALLLDFDGTIVHKDILSELVALVGKKAKADNYTADFQAGRTHGLEGLIGRINLLKGMTVKQIENFVMQDLALIDGAVALSRFCKQQDIITILATGAIEPVAKIYQRELGFDYIVCSHPHIENGSIVGIARSDYPFGDVHFKVAGIVPILSEHGIKISECVAVGDGRGDIPMFELAGYRIAINPKGGIEQYANTIVPDLHEVVRIIEKIQG